MQWIDYIFARFTSIYKTKWVDLNPTAITEEASKYEWARSLRDLIFEQIKPTIDHCGLEVIWPPIAPEFRLLAHNLFPIRQKYQVFVAVEWIRTPRDIALAEMHIANMRKILPKRN